MKSLSTLIRRRGQFDGGAYRPHGTDACRPQGTRVCPPHGIRPSRPHDGRAGSGNGSSQSLRGRHVAQALRRRLIARSVHQYGRQQVASGVVWIGANRVGGFGSIQHHHTPRGTMARPLGERRMERGGGSGRALSRTRIRSSCLRAATGQDPAGCVPIAHRSTWGRQSASPRRPGFSRATGRGDTAAPSSETR